MHITIQVSLDVAHLLHQRVPSKRAWDELIKLAEELDIVLKPVHPGTKDPHLAKFFIVEVSDPETAKRVKDRLHLCKAIEAAYIKPPDEKP